MNNGEFVSRVINNLNSLTKDVRLSKRYILHVGRRKAEFFISQKLNDRSLYKEDNIYISLPCFEMEKVDVVKCDIIEFRKCKSLMKSKNPLPKLIYSRYGSSLKEVTSIDSEKEFSPTTPSQYKRNSNRSEKSDNIEYYVKNDYLYLVDTEIEVVDLFLITVETDKVDKISSCSTDDCECKSLWDFEFITPSKLQEVIIAETLKEISLKLQIPEDSTPNLSSNEK